MNLDYNNLVASHQGCPCGVAFKLLLRDDKCAANYANEATNVYSTFDNKKTPVCKFDYMASELFHSQFQ